MRALRLIVTFVFAIAVGIWVWHVTHFMTAGGQDNPLPVIAFVIVMFIGIYITEVWDR